MTTHEVANDGGRIAVETVGSGPLVLCVPGMGETRAAFRHLTPGLAAAGFQVAMLDLRGHGESSIEFDRYDDEAAASDVLATIDHLGAGPAVVVGSSMGAAAGVLAAAARPDAVSALVLIGPFVRDHGSAAAHLVLRVLLARPWGPTAWRWYYASLFGSPVPPDHAQHVDRALAALRRPGRWRAFQRTTRTSHAPAEAALAAVSAPTLVVMGERDKDFPDPAAEAGWIASALRGRHVMVPGAGHYPMGEQPEVVLDAVLPFLAEEA